jgi:hypothetical protein
MRQLQSSSARSSPLVDMMEKGLWCLVVRSQSYGWSAVELNDGARSNFLDGWKVGEKEVEGSQCKFWF